ncbi:hypothetical protein ACKKBG_A19480 [Auxenochlorella protothecoides x Auxenochlorella symbiontica]
MSCPPVLRGGTSRDCSRSLAVARCQACGCPPRLPKIRHVKRYMHFPGVETRLDAIERAIQTVRLVQGTIANPPRCVWLAWLGRGGRPFQRNTSCIHGAVGCPSRSSALEYSSYCARLRTAPLADLVTRDGSTPADLVALQSMIDDGVILLPYPLLDWPQRNIMNGTNSTRSNIEGATSKKQL